MHSIEIKSIFKGHVLLHRKDQGDAGRLVGKTAIFVFYVNDHVSVWNDSARKKFSKTHDSAMNTVLEASKKFTVALTIDTFFNEITVPFSCDRDNAAQWINHIMTKMGHKLFMGFKKHYKVTLGYDQLGIAFVFNRNLHAYARQAPWCDPECSVLGASASEKTIIHELLHQFGARDLYVLEDCMENVRNLNYSSIMGHKGGIYFDFLTAYTIGWTEKIDEETVRLLEITKSLKFREYDAAVTASHMKKVEYPPVVPPVPVDPPKRKSDPPKPAVIPPKGNMGSDEIQRRYGSHILLHAMNAGDAAKLVGKTAMLLFFVNDNTTRWTDSDRKKFSQTHDAAMKTVMEAAGKHSIPLTIDTITEEFTVPYNCNMGNWVWLDHIKKNLYNRYQMGVTKYYKQVMGYKQVAIGFVFNRDFRAYALQRPGSLTECSVLDQPASEKTIIHEFLHQFGTQDLYILENMMPSVRNLKYRSIMGNYGGIVFDVLTAYVVGWTNEIDSATVKLLELTKDVTNAQFEEAIERNLKGSK